MRKPIPQLRLALLAVLPLAGCGEPHVAFGADGVRLDEGPGRPGEERGDWVYRYFDGSLRARGSFDSQGHRTGTWETYFRNGQPAAKGQRQWDADASGSLRTGQWTFWHENGFRRSRGIYERGLREGTWEFWKSDGLPDPAHSGVYRGGELVEPAGPND